MNEQTAQTFELSAHQNNDEWTEDPTLLYRKDNPWITRGIVRARDGKRGYFKHYLNNEYKAQGAYEYIVTELSRRIGISTPPMELLTFQGMQGLVSFFPEQAENRPCFTWQELPSDLDLDTALENPNDVRATAILDFWVLNKDRNGVNSIFCLPPGKEKRHWFAIDPGFCLTQYHEWRTHSALTTLDAFYATCGHTNFKRFLTSAEQVAPYLQAMERMPDGYIRSMFHVLADEGYLSSTEAEDSLNILVQRRGLLQSAVAAHVASGAA